MTNRPDKANIVAEMLASLVSTAGAVAATAIGVPAMPVSLGQAVLHGLSKYLTANLAEEADPKQILARLRDERTAQTVTTIRDTLVEAMGLKPEFTEPIDALADAVLAREDDRDEQRFLEALFMLFKTVTEITAGLDDIKSDTSVIREDIAVLLGKVKTIEAAVVPRGKVQVSTLAGQIYLETRVESLSAELRQLLDVTGRRKWDELNAALAERSWKKAFEMSQELEQWLDGQGNKISDGIKGQALLSLANVAVIHDSGIPFESHNDTKEAWRILLKAETAFGHMPSDENAQRLLRVRAKLLFIDGDHEEASKRLEQTTGPGTLSLQIAFLQEQDRWADASELANEQDTPHRKWADDAIVAHLRAGRRDRAEAVLQWAQREDGVVQKACILAFARTLYTEIIKDGTPDILLGLGELERTQLSELQQKLVATFASSLRDGPSSGIDAEALELVILLGHVRRDRQACQMAADSLVSWKPISFELGRGVLRGDIDTIEGLANRFLEEHSGIFRIQMLSAILLIQVENDAMRALDLLRPLLELADRDECKEEIATSIMIACQFCTDEIASTALTELEQVLGASHRLPTMLRSLLRMKQGELLEAEAELARVVDERDYLWLQISASISVQQEDWPKAAKTSRQLAELTGRFDAFQKEAYAWHRAEESAKEIEALEKARQLSLEQTGIVHKLAAAYHNVARYEHAAKQYEVLWETEPHTEMLTLNYASCLALNGKVSDAISKLQDHISSAGRDVAIEPLLMHAQLLHSQGHTSVALDSLLPRWDKLSENHHYLMEVMTLGYAANREDEAHKAFEKLVGMLNQDALPDGVLTRYTLDDMLGMHRNWQERRKHINKQYLSGRLPWLIASQWVCPSNHCYLSWWIRTQPLVPSDHPDSLAEFSIYSTNGFTAADQDGQRQLARLSAPPKDTVIVADISALITLHRLGLLASLGTCFSKILVPQSYKQIWIEEQVRIPHHQPKQIASRQAILDAVRARKISVIPKVPDGSHPPVLDEYAKESSSSYVILRIFQLAQWMVKAGKLTRDMLEAIRAKENQPALVTDEQVNEAMQSGQIVADVFTLQTVFDSGFLDDLCDGVHVSLARADVQKLESELRGQQLRDDAGQWHRELVVALDGLPSIEFAAVESSEAGEKLDAPEIRYGLDAVLLANERDVPLLADDRFCQQNRLNSRDCRPDQAFGTDILIERLADEGSLTSDQKADAVLQLMRWRYRFLFPSADILLTFADRFKNGLPGIQLRNVAIYVQDCMRDIGLYGGPERIDPPLPMALKALTAWLDIVADFIVRLWHDERFSGLQAAKLARWSVQHLMPGWPRNLGAPSWQKVAKASNYSFLSGVLIHLFRTADVSKATQLTCRVRRSMGITDEEYDSVVETVCGTMVNEVVGEDEISAGSMVVRLLEIAYGRTATISWRLLPTAESVGLVDAADLGADIRPEYVSAVADRDHPNRLGPTNGPFVYVDDGTKASGSFLPDMLCSSHVSLRRSVLENLLSEARCPKTSRTQAALQTRANEIRNEASCAWVPAVASLFDQTHEDFRLNMAGFIQSQERRHSQGASACWRRLIRPTPEALLSIDSDGWQLLPHASQIHGGLTALLDEASSLQELLDEYDRLAGHMTLGPPLDLGSQISEYIGDGSGSDVWPILEIWLNDKSKPWRRYHACQALLRNIKHVPADKHIHYWQTVAEVVELCLPRNQESDDAQAWRFESDLAAHYVRSVDLGGYGLEENRPITLGWWAARQIMEMLTTSLEPQDLPQQIRDWRGDTAFGGMYLIHNAWAWLSSKPYSPTRFASLYGTSPRSVALLIALGEFVETRGLESVPREICARLRDCFLAALLTSAGGKGREELKIWMWDQPLLGAAELFMSAMPDDEGTESVAEVVRTLKQLGEPEALKEALSQLATAPHEDSIFLCSRIRMYCYDHADAGDMLLDQLRETEWRDACAISVPKLGWEMMAHALFFLQFRHGIEWSVELPYVFLRLVESTSSDEEKSDLFLTCLIMSSLAGGTAGALKSIGDSSEFFALRPVLEKVRRRIDSLRVACPPDVAIRLRGATTILEQF